MKDEKTVKDLCEITGVSHFTVLKAINEVFPNKVKNGKKTVLSDLEALLVIQRIKGIDLANIEFQKKMIYKDELKKKPEVKKEKQSKKPIDNDYHIINTKIKPVWHFDDNYISALSKALDEKANTDKAKEAISKAELHDKRLRAITSILVESGKFDGYNYLAIYAECKKLAKEILEKLYAIR